MRIEPCPRIDLAALQRPPTQRRTFGQGERRSPERAMPVAEQADRSRLVGGLIQYGLVVLAVVVGALIAYEVVRDTVSAPMAKARAAMQVG